MSEETNQREFRSLENDYRVLEELGRGSQGRTLLVEERETQRRLVVKQLWLGPVDDWKAVELFERSADILRSIDHHGVPAYVDHLVGEPDEQGTPQMYLVREHAEGTSLLACIERGWRPPEDELYQVAGEILETLAYLHERDPPIVHRDIKPANIIRGPESETYRLVDFGTAQARILDEVGGSTMAGTAGYVPFEQLAGRASPKSDLYALGATLVHLASHTPPAELPSEDFRLDFEEVVDLSPEFRRFLADLTAPMPDQRPDSAGAALERLQRIGSDREPTIEERRPERTPPEAEMAPEKETWSTWLARGGRAVGWFCAFLGVIVIGSMQLYEIDNGPLRDGAMFQSISWSLLGGGVAVAFAAQAILSNDT